MKHTAERGSVLLLGEGRAALLCSPQCANGQSHQLPISVHPSSQSSFSSTISEFFDLRHPLDHVSRYFHPGLSRVHTQMFSLYLSNQSARGEGRATELEDIPFVLNGLYYEAKGWADGVYILVHNSLDDGGLSSIVKTSASVIRFLSRLGKRMRSHSIRMRISLSLRRALRKIESILACFDDRAYLWYSAPNCREAAVESKAA
jgi:hypothetical protein